jgi:aminoglycoside 3-N-acetyltransferase
MIPTLWKSGRRKSGGHIWRPFDPASSRACRAWGILCEYIRTRTGAHRSGHPGHSFVAIGAKAAWLIDPHPLSYGFGAGTPLERFVTDRGRVLILGAPLSTATILHHAECIANIPGKRIVRYTAPVLRDGRRTMVPIEEFDTNDGIVDWQGPDYFELIMASYIAAGKAKVGPVGAAQSYLLDAQELTAWAVEWMERHLIR